MFHLRLIAAALLAAALLSACGAASPTSEPPTVPPTSASGAAADPTPTAPADRPSGEAAAPDLTGTSWTLTNLETASASGAPIGAKPITISFETGGQLGGSAGCNSYFASYTQTGVTIAVGAAGSTKMACDNPLMDQESRFLTALSTVTSLAVSGDELVLSDPTGEIKLTFTKGS